MTSDTAGLAGAVEIASGVRCTQLSGAVVEISELPQSYSCPDGSGLYGDPSRGSTSRIKFSTKGPPNGRLASVALRRAWF
jgi:hypothetical protein